MNKGLAIVVYMILCLIWSSTWLMIKVGLEGAPPMTSAALRFIIASLIIFAILVKLRIHLPRTRHFILLSIFLGFFQIGAPYALVYWGEQYISSGLAAILFGTMPLFVAILARVILGDPMTLLKLIGIIIGTFGVYVIFSDSVSLGGYMSTWGMAAMILSSILASLSSVLVKKYSNPYHPYASLLIPMAVGGVILTAWGVLFEKTNPVHYDALTITTVLYLGIIGSVAAFGLYFWIIKHVDVTLLSYMTFIIPILACLLGWIFLRETLTINVLIGTGLIFAGIALATFRNLRRKGPRNAVHTRTAG
ncbi:MAG: EamA family transporter [Candidatus Latescibacteria bacterium]|nr:EamA family transporter [Candidatus Latescibacterota bacterium]NIO03005.1 EamA family transporter [Candidatus Latescibacterota bacterium]